MNYLQTNCKKLITLEGDLKFNREFIYIAEKTAKQGKYLLDY